MGNEYLIKSLNPTLPYLISQKTRDAVKAIVDNNGNGHYSSISAAIDAGEKYIFVKNGTYTESSDITLTGVTIIGESAQGVILTLTDATLTFEDNNSDTSTGTIKFTSGDKTVVGTGSNFSTVSQQSPFLYADGILAEVASVTDNTNLELLAKSYCPTQDPNGVDFALNYTLFSNDNTGNSIQNMTILHVTSNPTNCIELQGIRNSIINVQFKNISQLSTYIACPKDSNEISVQCQIHNCRFEGGAIGVKLNNTHQLIVSNCNFISQEDRSIEATSSADNVHIIYCTFASTNIGINFASAALNVTIAFCSFLYTTARAITTTSINGGILNLKILNCFFNECYPGLKSIELDADQIIFSGNIIKSGTTQLYVEHSENVTITNNFFINFYVRAIDMNSFRTQINWIIENNHFIAESGGTVTESGVRVYGTNHTVSGNCFRNIEEFALEIEGSSCVINGNIFKDCATNALKNAGDYNNISNNSFRDCTDSILITGDHSIITGNNLRDDLNVAILIQGNTNILSSNRVENSTSHNIDIDSTANKTICTSNITLNAGGTNLVNDGTNTNLGNNITS